MELNQKNCLNCNKLFSPKRSTGVFCDDYCRKQASRKLKLISVPNSVTNDSVTQKDAKNDTLSDTLKGCHGCGEEQPNPRTCICYKCIAQNITHASLGLGMCSLE